MLEIIGWIYIFGFSVMFVDSLRWAIDFVGQR